MPYTAHGCKTWSPAESVNLESSENFHVLGLAGRNGSLQGMPDSVTCVLPVLLVEMINLVLPCFPDPEALSAHRPDTEEPAAHELNSPEILGPCQQLCEAFCQSNRKLMDTFNPPPSVDSLVSNGKLEIFTENWASLYRYF